jgi:hypothetical protein
VVCRIISRNSTTVLKFTVPVGLVQAPGPDPFFEGPGGGCSYFARSWGPPGSAFGSRRGHINASLVDPLSDPPPGPPIAEFLSRAPPDPSFLVFLWEGATGERFETNADEILMNFGGFGEGGGGQDFPKKSR